MSSLRKYTTYEDIFGTEPKPSKRYRTALPASPEKRKSKKAKKSAKTDVLMCEVGKPPKKRPPKIPDNKKLLEPAKELIAERILDSVSASLTDLTHLRGSVNKVTDDMVTLNYSQYQLQQQITTIHSRMSVIEQKTDQTNSLLQRILENCQKP